MLSPTLPHIPTRGIGVLVGFIRALLVVVVGWLLFVALTGDTFWPVRLGINLAPWIVGLSGLLLLVCLVFAMWAEAIVAAVATAALAAWQLPGLKTVDAPIPGAGAPFSILSVSNRAGNLDMAATARFLDALEPDIAVLQEVADPGALAQMFPQMSSCSLEQEIVLSRYAVSSPDLASGPGRLLCKVALPDGDLMVGSIHLPKAVWSKERHDTDLSKLLDALAQRDLPVVIAGDFNTTPGTSAYARLSEQFRNAHDEVGTGFGFTFPTDARPLLGLIGPLVRIDHVFHSDRLVSQTSRVLDQHPAAADHFPMWTELSFAARGP